MSRAARPLLERLRSKIAVAGPDECWEWTGARLKKSGYGIAYLGPGLGTTTAHRAVWIAAHGPLAADRVVCHRCDNTGCANLTHLFEGSQSDNMQDKLVKGRHFTPFGWRGESNPACRHRDAQIASVRDLRVAGLTQQRISEMTGVSQTHVSRILRGESRRPR